MKPLHDPENPLAVEIRAETASTYFAACRKMVEALEALRAFDGEVASAAGDGAQSTRRLELLEDAAERVYYVVIHREAMKLSWYDGFFEDYGVPDEVKVRLGRQRRG